MDHKHGRKEDRKQPEVKVDLPERSEKDKEFFCKTSRLKSEMASYLGR
jgi:hypothetical protein